MKEFQNLNYKILSSTIKHHWTLDSIRPEVYKQIKTITKSEHLAQGLGETPSLG